MSRADDGQSTQDFRVDDPEQYNQSRRMRTIHDARDEARRARIAIESPEHDVGPETAAAYYRTAVELYIEELEPKLVEYEQTYSSEDGTMQEGRKPYYSGVELGSAHIHPPDDLVDGVESGEYEVIGDQTLEPKTYDVVGLRGYLNAPKPFAAKFSLKVRARHQGQTTKSQTVMQEMPIDITRAAHRRMNMFIDEIGLDLELSGGLPSDHISY